MPPRRATDPGTATARRPRHDRDLMGSFPRAIVRSRIDHRRRLSLIWAIPVVTVIIGGWLAWPTIPSAAR